MPKPSQLTGTPRPAIANLLKVAQRYRIFDGQFVLVDEKDHDQTRDELIKMIGEAYPEFASLARELSEIKRDYVAACDVLMVTHQAILGGRAAKTDDNPVEDAGRLRSRFNQANDVLRNILNGDRTVEQIKFIIGRFVDMNRRLGIVIEQPENVTPLVNENGSQPSDSTSGNEGK